MVRVYHEMLERFPVGALQGVTMHRDNLPGYDRPEFFGIDDWHDKGGYTMAAEDEVRQASNRFYAALNGVFNGDVAPMNAVWAHTREVTGLHPLGERGVGWDQVQAQFAQFGTLVGGGQVRLRDQLIRVGSDLAYEVGVEEGDVVVAGERYPSEQRVTNIYRREDGDWKLVHHHSDLSPAFNDLLRRLQPQLQSERT